MNFDTVRKEYVTQGLTESDLDPNPLTQFQRWYEEAVAANVIEPNAMTLATATRDGIPSARTILLKGFDERGFTFYTNYESQKGKELAGNPNAALVFYWATFERQIRITGVINKISPEESEAYFKSRPMGARLGAWVSLQSQVIPNREVLEERLTELMNEFADTENVPMPPYWGGYCLAPNTIEFWQGRINRLHDRFRY
ncbi:MAG: pyridoxamine 5'-phosphate oxidase, partial [Chloroflexota bacterium]